MRGDILLLFMSKKQQGTKQSFQVKQENKQTGVQIVFRSVEPGELERNVVLNKGSYHSAVSGGFLLHLAYRWLTQCCKICMM